MFTQKLISIFIALIFITGSAFAQDMTLNLQGTPEMHINGDSNIKTWDAAVNDVSASLTLQNIENISAETLTPESFKNLSITIPVEGIEAESGGLTKNIHKYLEEKDHPNITFELVEVTNIAEQDGSLIITAQGVINAAGKDNPVQMVVTANVQNGSIQVSGEQELLMTSFDIDPPTAVFGTIRSKDEFVVSYNLTFSRESI
ncbi:MAG: YceI family protein [Balneolaceae bacterium]|nr:YceI family protein [Balneolaceae bacterium]